ncbi:MAG: hypothetical protein ABI451_10250, partial [Dokdonella sp.]
MLNRPLAIALGLFVAAGACVPIMSIAADDSPEAAKDAPKDAKSAKDSGKDADDFKLPPFPADKTVHQTTTVAGKKVDYNATVGSLPVLDEKGKVIA